MLITDDEAKHLKSWVIKKLEHISDADSDVLADYVLALIRADTPDAELRANATENLEDFLRDNTKNFVDEIFRVVHEKSYLPGYIPPPLQTTSPIQSIPTGPIGGGHESRNGTGRGGNHSRKRAFNDSQDSHGQDPHYKREDRHVKQMRRGGGHAGGRGGYGGNLGDMNNTAMLQGLQGMPVPFNPNDPLSAILAMQAMGGSLPGMVPQNGFQQTSNGQGPGKNKSNARCRDYDTKGICTRGVSCPFDHGDNQIIIPPSQSEYDPKSPSMAGFPTQSSPRGSHSDTFGGRGRGRGRGDRGGPSQGRRNNRAEFSQTGPNYDKAITTVVVEQIPEESFTEEAVKGFFSDFGNIEEVSMQPYKRLALVKFDNYSSARAAYESPKVIFDNRFVKVYWYNPNTASNSTAAGAKSSMASSAPKPEQPEFDRDKFERDSAEAQKRLEERKELQKQNEDKLAELQKQKEELAKKQAEAKQKLQDKLKAKGEDPSSEMNIDSESQDTATNEESKPNSRTQALREKLKELEQEAVSLGLDPEPWNSPTRGRGRGRGRGSYRGWEGFRGGFDSSRGGYRGRGSFRGMPRGGGAYNLDNRPKAVKVEGVVFDEKKDENLKQHLFTIGEYANIEISESKTSQTVTFKDRKTAENFFYGAKDIPGVGKLEFSWVQTPLPPVSVPSTAPKDDDMVIDGTEDGEDNGNSRNNVMEAQQEQKDVDYDVAGDEDDWVT